MRSSVSLSMGTLRQWPAHKSRHSFVAWLHIPFDFAAVRSIGAFTESRPARRLTALTDAIGRALGGGSGKVLLHQENHPMTDATITKPAAKRPRKMARELQPQAAVPSSGTPENAAISAPPPAQGKVQSKVSMVLDLLRRPIGADLDELVTLTGWLPHTIRAALTGLRKKGHSVISEKVEGVRRYRVEAAAV